MGIFGNIFRGQDLENKKREFEKVKNLYLREGESISSDSIKLFESRKDSVRSIQRVKSYIDRLKNCPQDIQRGIAKALSYTDNFRETMQWEIDAEQSYSVSASSIKSACSMQRQPKTRSRKVGNLRANIVSKNQRIQLIETHVVLRSIT